jgi:hypothetical protein
MQITMKLLKSQQAVMRLLNHYRGPIDGLWGPESIASKKAWESERSFEPGIPSNGLPFSDRGPFPKGVYMTRDGLNVYSKEKDVESLVNPVVLAAEAAEDDL